MSTRKPLRAMLASSVSRSAAALSRMTGRGDGSVIGGRLGLMIDPNFLANLAAGREIALISGTNGKTTTTRLTAAAMGVLGDVATNSFGANMPSGHTSALARAGETPFAVLEVDEHYLPEVLTATKPRVVALLNLSRDQLDRAKEVAMMADLWRRTLAAQPVHVVANADDPMVTWAARGAVGAGAAVTWVAAGQRWHDDSWVCPECGSHIVRAVPGATIAAASPDQATEATAVELEISIPTDSPDAPAGGESPTDGDAPAGSTPPVHVPAPAGLAASNGLVSPNGSSSSAVASIDEMTLLMPTVPVPDATNPAGRLGGSPRGDLAPTLAPIAAPDTVPVTASAEDDDADDTTEAPGLMIATNAGEIPADLPPDVEAAFTATTPARTPAQEPRRGVPANPHRTGATAAKRPTTTDTDVWWCTGCDLRRPTPQWWVDGDAVIDPEGRAHVMSLQLPGRVNRANAATALAVAAAFGVDPAAAAPHLGEVASVAGRYAQVQRDGRNIRLLLAKNPAGWLEAFDMADNAPTLLSINSRDPDGLDTSWLFDVDFSPLRGRSVLITGERAYDLAVRLEINGIPFTHVRSFSDALRAAPAGRVEVIANYTAFQDIRAELDRVN